MRRMLAAFVIVGLLVGTAFAGGDQNRGDKGQGSVHQHQVPNK